MNNAQSIEQNAQIPAIRDEAGRFPPGVSGNPLGRPKVKHVSEAYKAILEEKGAESLAEVVWNDAHHAKRPNDRLAAIQEIADRIEGKPVQAHKVELGMDDSTARALVGLAGALLGTGTITIDADQPQLAESKGSEQE